MRYFLVSAAIVAFISFSEVLHSATNADAEIKIFTQIGSKTTLTTVSSLKNKTEITVKVPGQSVVKRDLFAKDYAWLIEKIKNLPLKEAVSACPRSFISIETKGMANLPSEIRGCLKSESEQSKAFDEFTFVLEAARL